MEFMLKDHPRPNLEEFPDLYHDLDGFSMRLQKYIFELPAHLFDKESGVIRFGRMSEEEFEGLVGKDPDVMVIAFTRVFGLTDREFETLYNLKSVYVA